MTHPLTVREAAVKAVAEGATPADAAAAHNVSVDTLRNWLRAVGVKSTRAKEPQPCQHGDCMRPTRVRGFCQKHYTAARAGHIPDPDDELTGGRWVWRDSIARWEVGA